MIKNSKNSTAIVFRKMVFILEELLRHPYQTREEICEKWLNDPLTDGIPIERRTFYNYRNQIENMFGILIDFTDDGHVRPYYIVNPEDLGSSNLFKWTLSALQMYDLLWHARRLHDRVLLDDFPSENGRMIPILEAMTKSVKLRIQYQEYGAEKAKVQIVSPYCIKQNKRRLYLVGNNEKGIITPYSFDRIVDLKPTKEKFLVPASFDAHAYFIYSYGVVVDEEKYPPSKVILRATANEAFYLRDVPIHHTQKEVASTAEYSDFAYTISITDDLIDYILSRADRLKVIFPASLAEEVKHRHQLSVAIYSDNIDCTA